MNENKLDRGVDTAARRCQLPQDVSSSGRERREESGSTRTYLFDMMLYSVRAESVDSGISGSVSW